MKNSKMEMLLFILTVCILFTAMGNEGKLISTKITNQELDQNPANIVINGNTDLRDQAQLYNWDVDGTRDGSPNLPYLIDAYSYIGISGIAINIQNTDLNIRIQDLDINGQNTTTTGISMDNVENVLIYRPHIYDIKDGGYPIELRNSLNVRIILGTFDDAVPSNSKFGLLIENSLFVTVRTSTFHTKFVAVNVYNSNRTIIDSNEFYDTISRAIQVDSSFRASIQNNVILNCGYEAIYLRAVLSSFIRSNYIENAFRGVLTYLNSESNAIRENTIVNSNDAGIFLSSDSNYNVIVANNITQSYSYGIRVQNLASYNTIYWNNLINNLGPGQIYDNGTLNAFQYNYFTDMTGSDGNLDRFYDQPYSLSGEALSIDPTPLTEAHVIMEAYIVYPSLNTVFDPSLPIEWYPFTSNYDSDITYRLIYRSDTGMTTENIVDGLTQTTYYWDPPQLPYGRYRIIVIPIFNNTFSMSISSQPFWITNHHLNSFNVISPNGGEQFSGQEAISWTTCTDPLGYSVFYNIYISTDNSLSWKPIALSIATTTLTYDFSAIAPGDLNWIKIVAYNELWLKLEDQSDGSFSIISSDTGGTTNPNTPPTDTSTPIDNSTPDDNQPTLDFTFAPNILLAVLSILVIIPLYRIRRKY